LIASLSRCEYQDTVEKKFKGTQIERASVLKAIQGEFNEVQRDVIQPCLMMLKE
jgi:hypothetical protein